MRLTDQKAQVAPIESKREDGRGHRPQGGINAATREFGIDRTQAQRAVKIASITDEAKAAAREAVAANRCDLPNGRSQYGMSLDLYELSAPIQPHALNNRLHRHHRKVRVIPSFCCQFPA